MLPNPIIAGVFLADFYHFNNRFEFSIRGWSWSYGSNLESLKFNKRMINLAKNLQIYKPKYCDFLWCSYHSLLLLNHRKDGKLRNNDNFNLISIKFLYIY